MQLAARLTRRLGAARATRVATLLFGAALPLPAFAPDLATLVAAAFAMGAANGLLAVCRT
jgi:MFS family permease